MCAPAPFGSGRRAHSLAGVGDGDVPIPTMGHTLWYSKYICTLYLSHFKETVSIFVVVPICVLFMILNGDKLYYCGGLV